MQSKMFCPSIEWGNGKDVYMYVDYLISAHKLKLDSNGFPCFDENLKFSDLKPEFWFIWRWIRLYREIFVHYGLSDFDIELYENIGNKMVHIYIFPLNIACIFGYTTDIQNVFLHRFSPKSFGKKWNEFSDDKQHEILLDSPIIAKDLAKLKGLILMRAIHVDWDFRFESTVKGIYNEIRKDRKKMEFMMEHSNIPLKDVMEKHIIKYEELYISVENNRDLIEFLLIIRDRGFTADPTISFSDLLEILRLNDYENKIEIRFLKSLVSEVYKIPNENEYILSWHDLSWLINYQIKEFVCPELRYIIVEYSRYIDRIIRGYANFQFQHCYV